MLRLGLGNKIGLHIGNPTIPTIGTLVVVSDTEITVPYTSDYPVEVWYSDDSGATYSKHGDSASTPYAMTGLTQSTLYYVKIRSVNGSKYSAFGSAVSAATIAGVGLTGRYYQVAEGGDLIDYLGGVSIPFVSGSGLDQIFDFSVLTDVRFNKKAAIDNVLGLPEYYDSTFQTEIYLDTDNPYYWKLQDFHYRYLELQFVSLSNIFFAKCTYVGGTISAVNELLIYSTEQTSTNLANIYTYINYNLPIPTFVAESVARLTPVNDTTTYAGNTLTVGTGGTYATITAAYAAASSGDIISILNDLDANNEAGNYLLINSVKNVMIDGNGFTLTHSIASSYIIRVRQTGILKFKDLNFISSFSQYTFYTDITTYVNNGVLIFDNCKLHNGRNISSGYAFYSTGSTHSLKVEFINCRLSSEYATTVIPSTTNDSGYIYLKNTKVIINTIGTANCYINNSTSKTYVYDSVMLNRNAAATCRIGEDTAAPTYNRSVDIRNSKFRHIGGVVQHELLIGRGTIIAYCINNTSNSYLTENSGSIGLVIKSIGTQLSDCIIKGNYFRSFRPLYIKGGQYNDVQYNIGINNSDNIGLSNGLHLNNAKEGIVVLNSDNNNIQNNKIYGGQQSLFFDAVDGAGDVEVSANACVFDNNEYYTYDQDVWLNSKEVDYEFSEKETIWTGANDANSTWSRIAKQDRYLNE